MKHKRALFIAVGAAVPLLALIIYFLSADTKKRPTDPFAEPGTPEFQRQAMDSGMTPKQVLAAYKEWSRFPPNSRPLSNDQVDVIDHYVVHLPYQQMLYQEGDKPKRSEYACNLQPLTHTVTEGMQMRITLRCLKGSAEKPDGKPVPVTIQGVTLKKVLPTKNIPLPSTLVQFGDDGQNGDEKANDQTYTFVYTPSRQDWAYMEFETTFEIPDETQGQAPRQHFMKTGFFSSPVAPAKFSGRVTDDVENGSLVVNVEVNVSQPGRYRIYANLKGKDGYLGTAKNELKLAAGSHMVPLLFFGKLFRDREIDGPYTVTGLRGYRDTFFMDMDALQGSPEQADAYIKKMYTAVEGGQVSDPDKQVIPNWNEDYTTKEYKSTQFSEKEWDSPEKRTRMQSLEDYARE
ncbi:MAG: hypothetical protein HY042_01975 [Spirochaetia bacterium]|nr:hypothetical protein [Spirochaetia bacterium]